MVSKHLRVQIGEAASSQRSYLLVLHGNVTCLTRRSYGSAIRFLLALTDNPLSASLILRDRVKYDRSRSFDKTSSFRELEWRVLQTFLPFRRQNTRFVFLFVVV